MALEITRVQSQLTWITKRKVVKVRSHIEREEALNIRYWDYNEFADSLATKARTVVPLEETINNHPILFPGTKLACIINEHIKNNNL